MNRRHLLSLLAAAPFVTTGTVALAQDNPAKLRVALLPDEERADSAVRSSPAAAYQPVSRERTIIYVADPTGHSDPRRYELAGNFEPEAFSADEQTLFLLEYLPPLAPDRYRVMQLNLRARNGQPQVQPLLTRDKRLNLEEMRGTGRMHAIAPSCRTLYTLYTRQPDHVHARDMVTLGGSGQSSGMTHAFVHVLSLSEWWAYCLDLPLPFGVGPSNAHALAPSPDGWRLYVADASSGQVAVADTTKLQVTRVDQVGQLAAGEGADQPAAATAVGPGGQFYLTNGSETVVADTTSAGLAATQRWSFDSPVRGIQASGDGQYVYVGVEDRVLVLEAKDGRRVSSVPVPGLESIAHVAQAPAVST